MNIQIAPDVEVTYRLAIVPKETPFGIMQDWCYQVEFGGRVFHTIGPISVRVPAIDIETGDIVTLVLLPQE